MSVPGDQMSRYIKDDKEAKTIPSESMAILPHHAPIIRYAIQQKCYNEYMARTTGFQPAIENRAEKHEEKITRQKPDIIGQREQASEQCARWYLIVEDIVSQQAKNREKICLECDVRHTLQFEPNPEIAGYEYEAIYTNYRDGLNKETYEVFYAVSWRIIP